MEQTKPDVSNPPQPNVGSIMDIAGKTTVVPVPARIVAEQKRRALVKEMLAPRKSDK